MSAIGDIALIARMPRSRRQAESWAREEADAIIEQLTRRAQGWDRGLYRDDDVRRTETIRERLAWHSQMAFALSACWSRPHY